jgi:hypothetical protein
MMLIATGRMLALAQPQQRSNTTRYKKSVILIGWDVGSASKDARRRVVKAAPTSHEVVLGRGHAQSAESQKSRTPVTDGELSYDYSTYQVRGTERNQLLSNIKLWGSVFVVGVVQRFAFVGYFCVTNDFD